jgi:DNA-binding transcriptional ArsR family regulator
MKVEYKKELHPLFETLGLIFLMKNWENVRSELMQSLEEMEIDGEGFYNKNLIYLERYVREFEKKYVPDPGEDFFFGNNEKFFMIFTALVMEYPELEADMEADMKADMEAGVDEKLRNLIELFFLDEECKVPAGLDTMEKRFVLVQSLDYSEDTKWKLLTLLNHPSEKFCTLFEIYRKNRPAFAYTAEKNQECLAALLKKVPSDIPAVMEELITGLEMDQITVYLTAALPLMGWLTSKTAFQGILLDKLYLYKKNREDAREILPGMLKVLGDKSKFEILYSLKERGKYNLEIAEELRLTPATVSHHMGILLSNRFVTVEKQDGKVYYQFNREPFGEMIRFLEEIFL